MDSWNQENFNNLLLLAAELETDARFQLLAEYCRLREKGRRQQAFHCLKGFIAIACSWDILPARTAAVKILVLGEKYQAAHQFLAQPLQCDFLVPVLTGWIHHEPRESIPLRWLGLLRHDMNMLRKALEISPDDIRVRVTLITYELSFFDDLMDWERITQGLIYPAGEATVLDHALKRARKLLIHAPKHEPFISLAAEADEYAALLTRHIANAPCQQETG